MAFQVGSVCYPTAMLAAQAFGASFVPVVVGGSSGPVLTYVYAIGDSGGGVPYVQLRALELNSGASTWPSYTYEAQTCVLGDALASSAFELDAAGGAAIAGAVLLIWGIGWGVRMVIRALNFDEVPGVDSGS